MFVYDYQQVKQIDEQRRQKSLARYEILRSSKKIEATVTVADVIDMELPEECRHTEPIGA